MPDPRYNVAQFTMFGDVAPPTGLDLPGKVGYILENFPETRGDDKQLVLRFWEQFDGLRAILGDDAMDKLLASGSRLSNPETIRRRRQEHQQLRTSYGHLRPDDATIKRRRAQDGAGPVR